MNDLSPFPDRLQRAFVPTQRGLAGLVDDLLGLCQEQGIQLDWRANRCRVRSLGAEPQESTEIPLPKSVFRAILARLAALCNERIPGSVSPYGGEGELSVGTNPRTVLRVAFTNTPGEQELELRPLAGDKDGATDGDASAEGRPSTRTQRLERTKGT
jgi:hypothetical protein